MSRRLAWLGDRPGATRHGPSVQEMPEEELDELRHLLWIATNPNADLQELLECDMEVLRRIKKDLDAQ